MSCSSQYGIARLALNNNKDNNYVPIAAVL